MTGPTPFDRIVAAFADRYKIVREIGAGGMATVYLAEDLKHRRQVALKVLRPELAATMGPERFFREIEVAARLQHPHILPLHDSGEADGFLFFVMPFVAGESLRERIDRVGELPINDAVRILLEVTDALSYSHAQGVVHRDIKPDNVMISGRHALVTDFGVAKAVSESAAASKVTTAGVALGTPAYMAPEQASAEPQMDHRVDIYAVGILAYELLTGAPPFAGLPPQKMLMAHVTTAPDLVSKHRDACPPDLEAIVMKCLAKRPADRWQTADELLEALEPLSASSGGITPTQTRPAASVTGTAAPPRTRARMMVGGALLAIGIAGAAWFTLKKDGADAAPIPLQRTQLTSTGNARSPAISADGSRIAYGVRVCDARSVCTFDVQVQDISGAGSATVARGLIGFSNLEWSADGRWLVFNASTQERWGSFAVPALGGTMRYLGCCDVTMQGMGDTAILTPVAEAGKPQVIRRVTVSDGVVRDSMVFAPGSGTTYIMWDAANSGRTLAAIAKNDTPFLVLLDRAGGWLDSLVLDVQNQFPYFRALSDGFVMAVPAASGPGGDLVRYRFRGNRIDPHRVVLARNLLAPGGLHIGRNGDLVIGDGAREFAVWALERQSLSSMTFTQRLVARSTSEVMGSITSSGDRIVLLRRRPSDPNIRELSTVPFGGGEEQHLASQPDLRDWDLAQDGSAVYIVVANGRDSARVIELSIPSARSRPVATLRTDVRSLETVPGGGFVYGSGSSRAFGISGVPSRRDTTFDLPPYINSVEFLEPSPDGKYVAVYAWDARVDTLVLHRLTLSDLSLERLAPFGAEGGGAPTWFPNGSILVPVQETALTQAWYMLPAGSRTPVRLGFAPRTDASFRFSRDGLRGVAREGVLRPDVFVLRGLAEEFKR